MVEEMAVMDDITGPETVTTSIKKNMDSKKNIRNQKDVGMV